MIKQTRIMLIALLMQLTSSLICFGGDPNSIKVLKTQVASMHDDTAKIRVYISLAWKYYYAELPDSCEKYAGLSRSLVDRLLDSDKVKADPAYARKCQIYKAMAIRYSALALEDVNINTAIDSMQLAMKIIMETGDKNGIAAIYQSMGWLNDYKGHYDLALENYKIAKSIYEETGNQKKLGYLLSLIGVCQRYTGNYGDAIESQMQALKIGTEVKDSLTITEALLALGFTYLKVEKWQEALNYQKKALDFLILMKDSSGIARTYSDLGVTYMSKDSLDAAIVEHLAALDIRKKLNESYSISSSYFYLGSIYKEQARYDKALESFSESYNYAMKSGYSMNIIDSQLEMGNIYHKTGRDDLAMKSYHKMLAFSREKQDWIGTLSSCRAIGDIYFNKKEYMRSVGWYKKAISYAPLNAFTQLNSLHKKLADAYILLGNYKKGFEHYALFTQMKDSLSLAENADKITRLTSRLAFENKQALLNDRHDRLMQLKQLEVERQKLTRNFSLLGMGIILILSVILFIRFLEKKKLNKKLHLTLSNLKSTQSQLIQAEKMASLGELTAGVAHEIQNPLNFVNNFSEVSVDLIRDMEEEIDRGNTEDIKALSQDLKQNLEKITEHGRRASSIVNGMLEHSRKGSGQKEAVDINRLTDEYLRLAYHGLRAKDKSFNAIIETDFDSAVGSIYVVPQDIGRVILNLLTNAFYAVNEKRKRMDDGPENDYKPLVTVATKKNDGFARITIKDNGNGIPQEIKDKIFQPFFTTKPTGEGTGLGLSLSYDIITKGHGGTLEVRTKEEEFTEFIIKLPVK